MTMTDKIISFMTAEFFLKKRPNGGKAVLFRSLFITTYLYLFAIVIKSFTAENSTFSFSLSQFVTEVNATIPWLGAIFGATYAALYTRFSSQWSYLAGFYNQQIQASLSLSEEVLNGDNYAIWQAAFIEDAVCMHLATKIGFSNAILMMIKEEKTRKILEEDQHFGNERVAQIEKSLEAAVKKKL
ncbi:MAG: hypothetical protein V4660_20770 [Pseudomonadota bacterium]